MHSIIRSCKPEQTGKLLDFTKFPPGIWPTTPNSVSPVMVTEPRTVSLARGERARLECKVSHLADHQVLHLHLHLQAHPHYQLHLHLHLCAQQNLVWRRGYDVLATGPLLLSPDPRIAVDHKGGGSTYTCVYTCNSTFIQMEFCMTFYL